MPVSGKVPDPCLGPPKPKGSCPRPSPQGLLLGLNHLPKHFH